MNGKSESKSEGATPPLDRAARERLRGLCEARPHATEIGEYHVECRSCNEVFSTEEYGPADEDLIAVCSGCAYKFADQIPRLLDALDAAEARAERAETDVALVGLVVKTLWRRLPHPFALVPPSGVCDYCGAERGEHDEAQGRIASAESALNALRAEAEGMRARLRAVVEAAVVKRPLVTADDVLAYNLSLAAAAEAAAKREGA